MRKLLSTLFFIPTLAIASVDVVHFESICVSQKVIEETLIEHGEKAFVTAVVHRLEGEKKVFHPVVIFMNPHTKTWTVVERVDKNTFCIIAVGSKIEPFLDKKPN